MRKGGQELYPKRNLQKHSPQKMDIKAVTVFTIYVLK